MVVFTCYFNVMNTPRIVALARAPSTSVFDDTEGLSAVLQWESLRSKHEYGIFLAEQAPRASSSCRILEIAD